jgi:hypothetical protein
MIVHVQRKRFFLKKEAKTFARLSPASPRQPRKSFLVLFFKKELLSLRHGWQSE